MSTGVVAGPPTPARIDWAMFSESDFTVPMLWKSGGTVVDLTAGVARIEFADAPTGKRVPADISSSAANVEGATLTLSDGTTGSNMVVFIPAASTSLYAFQTSRYTLTVTVAGLGTLRWAEGDVSFKDGP